MKNSKRELEYAKAHFNEVHHTTINPEGPGVVRVHLIPPVITGEEIGPSIAIINGQDIIPIGPAWSILLTEFIEEVNVYDGKEITESDFQLIENHTFARMKKIYPLVPKSFFRKDLYGRLYRYLLHARHMRGAECHFQYDYERRAGNPQGAVYSAGQGERSPLRSLPGTDGTADAGSVQIH